MITITLSSEHVRAMVKALKETKAFSIEKTQTTIIISHKKAGEVFRALKHGKIDMWIVRHVENLFI